eukprot:1154939-Pelagomonas_calceolata.AAC.3
MHVHGVHEEQGQLGYFELTEVDVPHTISPELYIRPRLIWTKGRWLRELRADVHGQRGAVHGGGVCGVTSGDAGAGAPAALLLARAASGYASIYKAQALKPVLLFLGRCRPVSALQKEGRRQGMVLHEGRVVGCMCSCREAG